MRREEFRIKFNAYSVLRSFAEFKIVIAEKLSAYCVGGCVFDNDEITFRQDFFKESTLNPFVDANEKFAVKACYWNEDNNYLDLCRQDGDVRIYCYKPVTDGYFDVDHAVYNEKSFCNEYISDDDSHEINRVFYKVVNPARTKKSCVEPELLADMNALFHTSEYPNTALKLFYVKDYEKRVFYMGLWDAENHCPIFEDPSAPSNSDYLDEYALFFPQKS